MKNILYIVLIISLFIGISCSVQAQDAVMKLADPAFGKLQRPPVPFGHDKHIEVLGGDSCKACHHALANGKRQYVEGQEQKCSTCHKVNAESGSTSLMRAFHKNCQGCHRHSAKKRPAVPVTCGGCHPKK